MSNKTVVETVTALVEPILAEHNFELYEVEFVQEAKSWYLRVYIDKEGGITLEDCA
ncbi:MAG: ribosome maturation factor RimP, partial [Limosilactobacillus fermentum]